tara:strand:- start:337 stop:567 length:231 start_codon:yes stop_codon:yes gene_type:complete
MIEDSSRLKKGQALKVDILKVKDRLPSALFNEIESSPVGELVGWKMVDGNSFGLVILFKSGSSFWFFEEELSEVEI